VVDATGIQASVARSLGVARNEYDSVVSLCAFYTVPKTTQSIARTLVSATANGWWYGTQLPGQRALVSFCTDAQTLKQLRVQTPRRWFAQLCQVPWFKQACEAQFDLPLHQPAALHARAAPSAILSNCVGKRWLAVGDAAASYDSITSAGITKALDQGIAAGRAIATTLGQQDTAALTAYQRKIFADFGQYLNLHQQLYSAEQRFTESGFWQRRMLA